MSTGCVIVGGGRGIKLEVADDAAAREEVTLFGKQWKNRGV
jgi:hypothetical protein